MKKEHFWSISLKRDNRFFMLDIGLLIGESLEIPKEFFEKRHSAKPFFEFDYRPLSTEQCLSLLNATEEHCDLEFMASQPFSFFALKEDVLAILYVVSEH